MCTAIIKKGADLLYGYNLDIDPQVWDFELIKRRDLFSVGIRVGSTLYYTHGVNANGSFDCLPYMNGEDIEIKGGKRYRLDLLCDRYLRGKISFSDVCDILNNREICNAKGASMHSLLCNGEGDALLIEPGYGIKKIKDCYAVVTNFPILTALEDYSNPFFGKDRYDTATDILKSSERNFGYNDMLKLLKELKQDGRWGTRISFVYSKNENAVFYCLNGDFDNVGRWDFR
ncbi:MAG: hypothetical protein PUB34_01640 [Clostridia bacterium]|nr:hypothetical protein [Clostridia bacterium]